ARLLADGVQPVLADDVLRFRIAARDRRLDPDPVRLLRSRLVGPVRLFRMARPLIAAVAGVEHDDHGGTFNQKGCRLLTNPGSGPQAGALRRHQPRRGPTGHFLARLGGPTGPFCLHTARTGGGWAGWP